MFISNKVKCELMLTLQAINDAMRSITRTQQSVVAHLKTLEKKVDKLEAKEKGDESQAGVLPEQATGSGAGRS